MEKICEYYKARLPQQNNLFYSNLTKAKQDSTATTTHQTIQGGNSTFTMPSSLISDPKVILKIQQIRTSEYSAKYTKNDIYST